MQFHPCIHWHDSTGAADGPLTSPRDKVRSTHRQCRSDGVSTYWLSRLIFDEWATYTSVVLYLIFYQVGAIGCQILGAEGFDEMRQAIWKISMQTEPWENKDFSTCRDAKFYKANYQVRVIFAS